MTHVTLICDYASSCSARQCRRIQDHQLAQNSRVGRLGPRLVLGHFWHRRRPLAYDHAWTTPPHQRVVHTVLRSCCVPSHRYTLAEAFSPQTFRQHPSHRRIIVRCRWQNRLAYRKPRSLAITVTQKSDTKRFIEQRNKFRLTRPGGLCSYTKYCDRSLEFTSVKLSARRSNFRFARHSSTTAFGV